MQNSYNVGDFGAFGDGVTDDTTAINAAINVCAANAGGIVDFNAGKYLISGAGLSLPSGVALRGVNDFSAWFYPGIRGTRIVCAPSMVNPLVNVAAGTDYFAVDGIAFSTTSGNTTAPTIQVNGTAVSVCGNAVFRNIESSNLGGIYLNHCNRTLMSSVVLQSWRGNYGFYFNGSSIILMEFCSSASSGVGTSPSGPYVAHYGLYGAGSLVMLDCGGAGQPYYGMDIVDGISICAYDFENNGATQAVVHITGSGGDLNFHRIYNNGPACVNGFQFDGACNYGNIQVIGGDIGNFTGSALSVAPSSGQVARGLFSGVYLGCSPASPYFYFSGPAWSWAITNNVIAGVQPSPQILVDTSTQQQRRMLLADNLFELTQGPGSISVPGPVLPGYGWSIKDNPGLNPAGKIATPPPVGPSGSRIYNNTGYDCNVYVSASAWPSTTVTAISIGSLANTTGLVAAPGSTVAVHVPACQSLYLTYTGPGPAPYCAWFGA